MLTDIEIKILKREMLQVRTLELTAEINAIKLRLVKFPEAIELKHQCFIAESKRNMLLKEIFHLSK